MYLFIFFVTVIRVHFCRLCSPVGPRLSRLTPHCSAGICLPKPTFKHMQVFGRLWGLQKVLAVLGFSFQRREFKTNKDTYINIIFYFFMGTIQ